MRKRQLRHVIIPHVPAGIPVGIIATAAENWLQKRKSLKFVPRTEIICAHSGEQIAEKKKIGEKLFVLFLKF